MRNILSEIQSIIFEGRARKCIEKYLYRYRGQDRIKAIDRLIIFLQSMRKDEEERQKRN